MKQNMNENENYNYRDQINMIKQKFGHFVIGIDNKKTAEPVLVLGEPKLIENFEKFNIW